MPDNLRYTLLFASSLQVLGPKYDLTRQLEKAVKRRGNVSVNDQIMRLPDEELKRLLGRLAELMCQLPSEARPV